MKKDTKQATIIFINMAKGFGGGEFYTEQLITHLDGYQCYFFGKKSGKLAVHLKRVMPSVTILTFFQLLKLIVFNRSAIVHALDGRGAHIAGFIKRFFKNPVIITRQVNFPFKRKSSTVAYKTADIIIGVSRTITTSLQTLNTNTYTIYGCLKQLQENIDFEQTYFSSSKNTLRIAQIGNFQAVKNFSLTIELARKNPELSFYLVGSGELEKELRQQASLLLNVHFIPFTPYIGSVLKHIDVLIVPSHSEGLGMTILEAYQYQKAVIAHNTGGIPEIIEHNKTGFLINENVAENYQFYLEQLKNNPDLLNKFSENIQQFLKENNFSAVRMANEYSAKYEQLLKK
ncbi:glycosyltransferase family 4 protein [Mannheimia sp. AT1]|uniref:Glycosyltransferase family 4 protein n=1 Tax=Mannheimia cairinae TaxID=3025936 RepID=A0ABT5MS60_9PAST|nr:glycosyltransferase family 4 protein [Mannheimia cairinae]MDD0824803.1 glycosyltransferase family 4 protein [Mannheimia cairinae]MDD0826267.1 glycosyltransferase family 4 protein [Mannheimia cairinae]